MLVKLEDVCEFITDGTHQTPTYCNNGGFIFLSSKDVTKQKIDWDNAKRIPEDLHKQLCARLRPRKNDILLAKNGTTGVAAIVDRDEIFDVYVSLEVLRPLATIFPKYLLYVVNSPYTKHQFNAGLKGIGVPNLHLNIIRQTRIKLHNLDQQHKIVSILDQVNHIISLRTQQLEQLDLLIKSRFVEMFGDNKYKNVTMKEVTLIITDGTHQPPKFEKTGIPFIFVSNITNNELTYNAEKFINEETYQELYKRTPIEIGDCLLSSVGSYGHCAVVKKDKKFLFQRHISYLKPNKTIVNSYFLQNAILSKKVQWQIETAVKGIAQKTLNLSDIKKLLLPLPPLALQDQFAAFVEEVEKEKATVKQSLEWLNTLKASLMQDYFG